MKSEKTLLIALALVAGPAAAQVELGAAFESARAAVASKPAPAAAPVQTAALPAGALTSCAEAGELETPFEMTLTPNASNPIELKFAYAGCDWYERNDYILPYADRAYRAKDGYELTILSSEDNTGKSEILLAKDKKWIGTLDVESNALLASGDPVSIEVRDHEDWRKVTGSATLRNAAKPFSPQLKTCETADWSKSGTSAPKRDASGRPATGWTYGPNASLVLLTKTAAFYYYKSCDICADVVKCDLASGKLTEVVQAHEADCGDVKQYRSEADVVYDACGPLKP